MPELVGKRFGRLLVIKKLDTRNESRYWQCRCDCGIIKDVRTFNLTKGTTVSCGCFGKEATSKRFTKHGMASSPEYHCWQQMIARCTVKNHQSYADYGGRGIKVCSRWLNFENFFADMGKRPTSKHSLDRKNNQKSYSPLNCRWTTSRVQSCNKRNSIFLTFDNKTLHIFDWAAVTGLLASAIRTRLKLGWSVEKTLTTPVLERCRNARAKNKSLFTSKTE